MVTVMVTECGWSHGGWRVRNRLHSKWAAAGSFSAGQQTGRNNISNSFKWNNMITKTPGAMCVFWNMFGHGVRLLPVNNRELAHIHTDMALIPLSPPKNVCIDYVINLKFIIQCVDYVSGRWEKLSHKKTRTHSYSFRSIVDWNAKWSWDGSGLLSSLLMVWKLNRQLVSYYCVCFFSSVF